MELSRDQNIALISLMDWVKTQNKNQFITLGGYAGTGKTTLIAELREKLSADNPKIRFAFASYTGKATRVLKNKLDGSKAIFEKDTIGTIHSLIYSPILNSRKEISGWKRKDVIETDIIIIDEASMVDQTIWNDLLEYKLPIIAVGDHGQLPPISGSFNLMEKPELRLEQIHRQVEGNPIIKLATMARKDGVIPAGKYGDGVIKMERLDYDTQEKVEELLDNISKETLVLCGYNNTRIKLNSHIRKSLGFETENPSVTDRIICLRNNHKKGIYNGMLGVIAEIKRKNDQWYESTIEMDGEVDSYQGLILASQFNNKDSLNFTQKRALTIEGDLFDFGYALTVHKAQGSQAKKVILFEERFAKMSDEEWRRWLYTGVTRAEEELYLVG